MAIRFFQLSLILAMVLAAFVGLDRWHFFEIKEVALKGSLENQNSFFFDDIRYDLAQRLDRVIGQKIWKIDLNQMTESLAEDSRIEKLQIVRRWPSRIDLYIHPREPLAVVLNSEGQMNPIGPEGQLLKSQPLHQGPDLPVLVGRAFLKKPSLREAAIQLLKDLPSEGPLNPQNISEIRHGKQGFELVLVQSGLTIRMGHERLGPKAGRVEKVIQYLENQQIQGRVIDARFKKKVVVRLRNGS